MIPAPDRDSESRRSVLRRNEAKQGMLRRLLRSALTAIALALLSIAVPLTPHAAAQDDPAARELVVGTKEAPPFAIKNDKGEWSGVSIDLWRKIADKLKLKYRFVETSSVTSLLDGLQDGSFDLAVAAITVRRRGRNWSISPYLISAPAPVSQSRPTIWQTGCR
jgi:polar amino acid transport system substrate-binding protein